MNAILQPMGGIALWVIGRWCSILAVTFQPLLLLLLLLGWEFNVYNRDFVFAQLPFSSLLLLVRRIWGCDRRPSGSACAHFAKKKRLPLEEKASLLHYLLVTEQLRELNNLVPLLFPCQLVVTLQN